MDRKLPLAAGLSSLLIVAACMSRPVNADTTKPGTSSNDAAVRQAVDSMDRKFEVAMKAGDAATAASFYEENATSMPPNAEPTVGRAAIQQGYESMLKGTGKISEFQAQAKDVDVYSDHVIEVGSYSMTFTPPGAKDAMKDHGGFINYWRKQPDGTWKIHRDAIVSATPMPTMPPAPAKK